MNEPLKPGEWSKKYTECVHCKTTNYKFFCRGFCKKCWDKLKIFENHGRNCIKKYEEEPVIITPEININDLLERVKERQEKGLHCLVMIIDDKEVYFPFNGLPKKRLIDEDKQTFEEFNILKEYYEANTQRN